jgi:predicted enzyme related to lactoylglutathione lyase
MLRVNAMQVLVSDQDEALAFYTEKLGMETRVDAAMPGGDGMRWLTVGPAGQPDFEIALMAVPMPPFVAAETAQEVRALMAKGVGTTVFLESEDCQATYDELTSRGVEYAQPPEERPYGWESGLRDPSGNYIRITQKRG